MEDLFSLGICLGGSECAISTLILNTCIGISAQPFCGLPRTLAWPLLGLLAGQKGAAAGGFSTTPLGAFQSKSRVGLAERHSEGAGHMHTAGPSLGLLLDSQDQAGHSCLGKGADSTIEILPTN